MEETAINVRRRGFSVHDTKLFCQFANIEQYAKLDILTAVTLKISVFWDVVLCILLDVYQTVRGNCNLCHLPQWKRQQVPQ
jgi:hypothetical protein